MRAAILLMFLVGAYGFLCSDSAVGWAEFHSSLTVTTQMLENILFRYGSFFVRLLLFETTMSFHKIKPQRLERWTELINCHPSVNNFFWQHKWLKNTIIFENNTLQLSLTLRRCKFHNVFLFIDTQTIAWNKNAHSLNDKPLHPAASLVNSAICEETSEFCIKVSLWKGCFLCSFLVQYPQISKSIEIYLLFGQCSWDVQLVGFNFIEILKDKYWQQ